MKTAYTYFISLLLTSVVWWIEEDLFSSFISLVVWTGVKASKLLPCWTRNLHFWIIFSWGIEFRVVSCFLFQHFKINVTPLSSGLHGFWLEVSYNAYHCSPTCNVSFFSGCLQDFYFLLLLSSHDGIELPSSHLSVGRAKKLALANGIQAESSRDLAQFIIFPAAMTSGNNV